MENYVARKNGKSFNLEFMCETGFFACNNMYKNRKLGFFFTKYC